MITLFGKPVFGRLAEWRHAKHDDVHGGCFGQGPHMISVKLGVIWKKSRRKIGKYVDVMSKPRLPRVRRKLGPARLRCLELMGCNLRIAFKDFAEG